MIQPTMTPSLDHHHRSVEPLLSGAGFAPFLDVGFPIAAGERIIRVDSLVLSGPHWWDLSDLPRLDYRVSAAVAVSLDGGNTWAADTVSVGRIPALMNPYESDGLQNVARLTAHEDIPLVGGSGHDGLYVGRPLVPLAQLLLAPGVHLLQERSPSGTARGVVALVPDIGPTIEMWPTGSARSGTLAIRVGYRRATRFDLDQLLTATATPLSYPPDDGEVASELGDDIDDADLLPGTRSERVGREALTLAEVLGGTERRNVVVLAETESRISEVLGVDPVARFTALASLLDRLRTGPGDEQADRIDPRTLPFATERDALEVRYWGGLMRSEIVKSIRRAAWRSVESDNHRITARQLVAVFRRSADTYLRSEVERIIRGEEGVGSVVVPDDQTCSLARIEQRRQITRFGPDGLPHPIRGRVQLREVTEGFRGTLCPLQTPESSDIGLVRFFALGHGVDLANSAAPRDLSVGASLIPYLNHDDPARASIASKNLKQAVPLLSPETPRISTIGDQLLGEVSVARSTAAGVVTEATANHVTLSSGAVATFGPALPWNDGPDPSWRPAVAVGERVSVGQIVAHAPDIALGPSGPRAAYGLNALVAYTPWFGWNFEDGIVISETFAERAASRHLTTISELLSGSMSAGEDDVIEETYERQAVSERATPLVAVGDAVRAGDTLATVAARGVRRRSVLAAEPGTVVSVRSSHRSFEIVLEVIRPLRVGDKLTNRHGAKGIVSAVLPVEQMPGVVFPNGERRTIEMILNPLGAFRRLNVGQFLEAHRSLLAELRSEGEVVAGRRSEASLETLSDELAAAGAPLGRCPLVAADEAILGDVVTGWQYFAVLDHLAVDKRRERSVGAHGLRDGQPSRGGRSVGGSRIGGSQRMGEMEMWALRATGARHLLDDLLGTRSAGLHGDRAATLRSIAAHLGVAGLDVFVDTTEGVRSLEAWLKTPQATAEVLSFHADWSQRNLRELALEELIDLGVDVLHDGRHGLFEEVQCPCASETSAGVTCSSCGNVARMRPSPQRSELTYEIRLPEPFLHPWADQEARGLPVDELLDVQGLLLYSIPVLPPAYRSGAHDVLDQRYLRLAARVLRLSAALAEDPRSIATVRSRRLVQESIAGILGSIRSRRSNQSIAARLDRKEGLLRRGLLGRNANLSGRSVIAPGPDLGPEEVGLPRPMYDRLGLTAGRRTPDDVVIVNRQPTVHPYNLVALRARPIDGDAIRLHPAVLQMLGGDFDGDTAAVHRPSSRAARAEAWELLRPSVNQRSSRSHDALLVKRDQDIALGLAILTSTVEGRDCLERITGVPTPERLEATNLDAYIGCVVDRHDVSTRMAVIAETQRLAFAAASGWSCGLLDLSGVRSIEQIVAPHPLGIARSAAVAGKEGGLRQLVERRGRVEGLLPAPDVVTYRDIASSFARGLDDDEYWGAVPGAIAKLSEKKLVSPLAGGLTKLLVDIAYDAVVIMEDCGRDGHRDTSSCSAPLPHVCSVCYGPDARTQLPVPVGVGVGVLAGTLIGERGLEGSMKTFQGGGTNASHAARVQMLRGVFGAKRARRDESGRMLVDYLPVDPSGDPELQRALYRVGIERRMDDAIALLPDVDPRHVQIIGRALLASMLDGRYPDGMRPLAAVARRRDDPLTNAASIGSLQELVFPRRRQNPAAPVGRLNLFVGR